MLNLIVITKSMYKWVFPKLAKIKILGMIIPRTRTQRWKMLATYINVMLHPTPEYVSTITLITSFAVIIWGRFFKQTCLLWNLQKIVECWNTWSVWNRTFKHLALYIKHRLKHYCNATRFPVVNHYCLKLQHLSDWTQFITFFWSNC